jgi:hypothetical protein
MQGQQADDFFLPTFLLKLPSQPKNNRREKPEVNWNETQTEDFLKGIQGWSEYFPIDECVE